MRGHRVDARSRVDIRADYVCPTGSTLQSLDNVNLLGLADLLRRVKATRQVIVSTHDERLAGLLERKLRPVRPGGRTIRIDLEGWTPDGPSVSSTDVTPDVAPLRLVAGA